MEQSKVIRRQFLRFVVVGGISTIFNYAIFYAVFHFMGLDYLLSSAIGFMAGVFLGFAMNKGWTFESSETSYIHLVKYVLIYCISLGISLLFLKYIIEANGINKYAGNIIAIGITTCTNFIGIKLLVFNR